MRRLIGTILPFLVLCLTAGTAQSAQSTPQSAQVSRSTKAIGYVVGGGDTTVDLRGTQLMPGASGEAKVEAKTGVTTLEIKVVGMGQATKLGTEILTFVLWTVSPDGRTINVGEIQPDNNGKAELKATTQQQTFSLIVTAEPYFSVRRPSELVVMENEIRKGTKGKLFPVDKYLLMQKSQYEKMGNPLALSLDLKKVPLEMYQARNAVEIAKSRKADQYAGEIFTKAEASLKMAENALSAGKPRKEIISTARTAVQFSEDARALAADRQEQERIANERTAAAAKAKADAEAKAAAEAAEAKRKADAEAKRQAELAAAKEAQLKAEAAARQAQLKAEADAREAKMRAEAEVAAMKAKAEADALKAKEEAAKAEAERVRQAAEALRAKLLDQFNKILETRDTPRGLVVNMGDVLFDTGKYTLRQEAREKLARLSGIVLAHPGLALEIEGHTDSTGSDEFNQKLSEQRAGAVREYLITQGLAADTLTSKGFGKSMPVAENTTAAGRQKNRRVELVVSGEVIGVKIGK